MQSSSVKSEMYPVWAVSLLTLFGCVDPVTTYNSLDYKGPLSKVAFQLCLYCGYVLLMGIPTISSVVGNLAICVLTAITFIKGFHRSMALVLPSTQRSKLDRTFYAEPGHLAGANFSGLEVIDAYGSPSKAWQARRTCMYDISVALNYRLSGPAANDQKTIIEDVCTGYCLSYLLRRRFLGLDTDKETEVKREEFERLVQDGGVIDYKRILKVIEAELAFLYDVFFTSNEFLHYFEAKTSSFWAMASFIGICFVGVATAIPGTMISSISSTGHDASTVVVSTTTADLVITLIILASLALLQLVELIRCWTSNWGKVIFACELRRGDLFPVHRSDNFKLSLLIRMNWFDKYLWQDKLGQHSLVAAIKRRREGSNCVSVVRGTKKILDCIFFCCDCIPACLSKMLGLKYIGQVLRELFGSDTKGETAIRLDDDVKTSIADFLGQKIKSTRIGKEWSSLFDENGIDASDLPYNNAPLLALDGKNVMSDAYAFAHRLMIWHIATWYCELAEQRQEKQSKEETPEAGGGHSREKNRRVATALSKYCAYLVVSAPELLPGPSKDTKKALDEIIVPSSDWSDGFEMGVYWGKWLRNELPPPPPSDHQCARRRCSDPWEVLALLWVQTLLYAAPYGDTQAHLKRLSRGGEFITHLWALLYHLGIDRWEVEPAPAPAQEEETDGRVDQKAAGAAAAGGNRTRLRRARSVPAGLGSTLCCSSS
ncbi:hypothetical protein C2845_PM03G18170 [Panicum miliaceum]|uniref:DUF4220 domain-containing protein n=1 Tax=Panicum miliaceum TaxID=4540 RepID=A0A3L6TFS6_PANMI|nr:hypothetical protein C2845_PM03G18170 [Panicum miliaceum]